MLVFIDEKTRKLPEVYTGFIVFRRTYYSFSTLGARMKLSITLSIVL